MNTENRDYHISIMLDFNTPSYLKLESLFYLMNVADDESINSICKLLENDKCELVRHEAAFALGEMASGNSIEVLKKAYENDVSLVVKHECLMSLGTIGSINDIDFLKKKIFEEKYEISCSAKIALQRILQKDDFESNVRKYKTKYIEKIKDVKNTFQNDRIQILFQLMNIADDDSIQAIYWSLKNDVCRIVRHEAAFVLGEIGTKKAVKYLIDGLNNEKTAIVLHEGLFALGTAGNEDAVDFIRKYLDDNNYVISESARIAIDRIEKLKRPYSGKKYFENLD